MVIRNLAPSLAAVAAVAPGNGTDFNADLSVLLANFNTARS